MAPRGRTAILLCAGYGTRMGSLTREIPKPLLPVAGKPLLEYLLERLVELPGIRTLELVTNHRYIEPLERWRAKRSAPLVRGGIELVLHDDGSTANENRRGGVGDLHLVLESIGVPEEAVVAGTDNIFRFSLLPIWNAFTESDESVVPAIAESDPAALMRSGVPELDEKGRLLRIHEKPRRPPSSWAIPSLYFLKRPALALVSEYLGAGHSPDGLGLYLNYVAERHAVRAFKLHGSRLHVGSPESLREADELMSRGQASP